MNSDPPGARILVDGKPRGVTPMIIEELSVGTHAVVVESAKGSLRKTVNVLGGRTIQFSESIYPAFVKIFSSIDLDISEGGRPIRLDDQNQALLPPGQHELTFRNKALGFSEVRQVEAAPGQTIALSIVPPPSSLTVTATALAEVLIDGERVGVTPLTNQPITLGTREIVVKSSSGDLRRFTKQVTVEPVKIDVDFSSRQ